MPIDTHGDRLRPYLLRALSAALEVDEIDLTKGFEASGGDSFSAAVVVGRLMDEIGADIPLQAFFESESLRDLLELIEHRLAHG